MERTCLRPECELPVRAKGLCKSHYKQDYLRRIRNEQPERWKEIKRRQKLCERYKIKWQDYDALLVAQDYKCAICGAEESLKTVSGFRLGVDHDHETGHVRGLLCRNCNRGLGLLGDTPDAIEKVLAYLRR